MKKIFSALICVFILFAACPLEARSAEYRSDEPYDTYIFNSKCNLILIQLQIAETEFRVGQAESELIIRLNMICIKMPAPYHHPLFIYNRVLIARIILKTQLSITGKKGASSLSPAHTIPIFIGLFLFVFIL